MKLTFWVLFNVESLNIDLLITVGYTQSTSCHNLHTSIVQLYHIFHEFSDHTCLHAYKNMVLRAQLSLQHFFTNHEIKPNIQTIAFRTEGEAKGMINYLYKQTQNYGQVPVLIC